MVFEKSLTAMVKGIRSHRGKEPEYINTCIQEIQKEVTSRNLSTKSMAILKLAYLNMHGYDMNWSSFAIVEVMSHNRFAIKRTGYLSSSMCFNEATDVGLLTINLFKKDFSAKSQYETGMALSCLGSICTREISRDLLTDLTALLSSSRAYLRKKTVLCLYRVFLVDPPALRTSFPKLKERLGDEDQGVLTAAVNTFLELARKNARNYLSCVPQLYHVLVNTTNNWLSIKVLKVFQLLCPLEPRLPAKMVEPLTNLLNTTKAQSVEFEAIRCTVRTMPEGTALMALAIEKLQAFLNSSDRNLRFLALELFKEILSKFKEHLHVPDLHRKVLESIEESDTTARKIALQLLDRIVTPASFVDTVKKLIEFSKSACSSDEFVGTILRMGSRDRYALVEDFPWYLLILADIARNLDSEHAATVAEQFTDITVRVPQVRPYAVALSLSLLDGSLKGVDEKADKSSTGPAPAKEGSLAIATPLVGSCAWVIGEYHDSMEIAAEGALLGAATSLLVPKHIQALDPAIQTQCVWAALKLCLGAPKKAPGVVTELSELLEAHLPGFAQSTAVDVAERAMLALHIVRSVKADAAKLSACAPLVEEPLLPVHPDAQKSFPVPDGLDLDEPFFPPEEVAPQVFAQVRAATTDPYALAATYKDDLGFLAAKDQQASVPTPGSQRDQSSMFYLGSKDTTAAGDKDGGNASGAVQEVQNSPPSDAFEQMRQRLMSNRTGGSMKFEVMRDDVGLPAQQSAGTPGAGTTTEGPSSTALPVPPEKELTELQGRLWTMCFKDDNVGVYACVRSKNLRKQMLRIDLRCERVVDGTDSPSKSISAVVLKLPDGSTAQEVDASGVVPLVPGELQERSAKVKMNVGLAPFAVPVACPLNCELRYTSRSGTEGEAKTDSIATKFELLFPGTTFLSPMHTTEEEIGEFIAMSQPTLLNQQTAQAISLNFPGMQPEGSEDEITRLVGRCAGLCNFHGIQQRSVASGKGLKFLLVAQPPAETLRSSTILPGQEEYLPLGARIVCLCAGLPKDGSLDIRLTVKSMRKDVCDSICGQLAHIFRESVEGRLRAS
eukprot:TRINITY_DN6956_c0_g1_i1.p1 TRINITY_DN6956_c0_g1~~TRINITY_DN6956_c0_g1_i1.p1  ORF type:complete len:1101 (+),score=233.56 TRINITY_DN6956_c0_g1_i1:113-3304(+)